MGKIILIQSGKGGSGGTTLMANIAAVLAQNGKRVCMMDACLDPYALAAIFEIQNKHIRYSLTDCLFQRCKIGDTIIKLPVESGNWGKMKGSMSVILSSMHVVDQARVLRESYDVGILADGIRELAPRFDYLLIDGGSALAQDMLLAMALADIVVVNTDWKYLTKPTTFIAVAERLEVQRIFVVLNLVPKKIFEIPTSEFKNNFNQPMALIPNSAEIRDELGFSPFPIPIIQSPTCSERLSNTFLEKQ